MFSGGITTPDTDGLNYTEEVKYGTDPTQADTDNDGLHDGREVEIGTNPTKKDTDNDGITDYEEIYKTDIYPDANPLQKDIYVEIDTTYSTFWLKELRVLQMNKVKQSFKNAPIKNPDGTTGINLHLQYDDENKITYNNSTMSSQEYKSIQTNSFENKKYNYYHILITDSDICYTSNCEITGMAFPWNNGAIVEAEYTYSASAHTITHELGHLLGLLQYKNNCIDSKKCNVEEYPSVMNYKTNGEYYKFNTSDWKTINNSLHKEQKYDSCMKGEKILDNLLHNQKRCL